MGSGAPELADPGQQGKEEYQEGWHKALWQLSEAALQGLRTELIGGFIPTLRDDFSLQKEAVIMGFFRSAVHAVLIDALECVQP